MRRSITVCIVVAGSVALIVWRSQATIAPGRQSVSNSMVHSDPTLLIANRPTPFPAKNEIPETTPTPDALAKVNALLKAGRAGDRDAQFNIAKIMRSCPNNLRKDGTRMSFEETSLSYGKYATAADVENIHREFERCVRMWAANELGTAGEWLALATRAKQAQAMALTAADLLWHAKMEEMYRNAPQGANPEPVVTDPALDTTLDPKKLLREAIESKNPDVYYEISHMALLLFPEDPNALYLHYSWMLVACQQGLDCGRNSDLAAYTCSLSGGACDNFKDPSEYPLWVATLQKADLSIVETRAAEITANLDAGQYDALGLQ